MQTLDDLLAQVASRGLRVANLFQFQSAATGEWRWQANLTDGLQAWEFGRGGSPAEALEKALAAISGPATPLRRPAPNHRLPASLPGREPELVDNPDDLPI